MNASPSDSGVDFVLVTALAAERDAVLARLPRYRKLPPSEHDIRTYFEAGLPVRFPDNATGQYRLIITCLSGIGRVKAATATSDAIRRWDPRYIILVGIAGGLAKGEVKIGDILISDQIVDYELQKLTPAGPEVRWEVHRADPRLLDASNNFLGTSWQKLIRSERPGGGRPVCHTGSIASGDKVIAFGEVLARYRAVWPKLIGVEMEAAGVATATFQSTIRPGFFMVRGVSDLADENKGSASVETWRSYACEAAASFTIALLSGGPVPLKAEATGSSRSNASSPEEARDEAAPPDLDLVKLTPQELDKELGTRFVEQQLPFIIKRLVHPKKRAGSSLAQIRLKSIAFLDIDDLTLINKHFGNKVGDEVLATVGRLAKSLGPIDYFGRCGDDTFYAVMMKANDLQAARICDGIRTRVHHFPWQSVAPELHVTCTIGYAVMDPDEFHSDWIRRAIHGLLDGKKSGGNVVTRGPMFAGKEPEGGLIEKRDKPALTSEPLPAGRGYEPVKTGGGIVVASQPALTGNEGAWDRKPVVLRDYFS